jgi:N-acetylneuraminic acid mutarotase
VRASLLAGLLLGGLAAADTSPRLTRRDGTAAGDGVILLANGDLLVAGSRQGSRTCEIYNARNNRWTPTGDLADARRAYALVRLADGRVLAAGGHDTSYTSSCEIFDPKTGSWKATGALRDPRGVHAAELLPDGRVLVAGGYGNRGVMGTSEVYDPRRGTWSEAGGRLSGAIAMTRLADGRVLACGGDAGAAAELFDGRRSAWIALPPMSMARSHHSAVALRDGRVLVFGNVQGTRSSELYDPASNRWIAQGELPVSLSYGHCAARLGDGRVLVCGGVGTTGSTAQVFDPKTGQWTRAADMSETRVYALVAPLADGRVMIIGGSSVAGSCEIYDPKKDKWEKGPALATDRRRW